MNEMARLRSELNRAKQQEQVRRRLKPFSKLPFSITGSIFKTLFNNSRESHLVVVAGTIDSPTTGQSELFESCYNL